MTLRVVRFRDSTDADPFSNWHQAAETVVDDIQLFHVEKLTWPTLTQFSFIGSDPITSHRYQVLRSSAAGKSRSMSQVGPHKCATVASFAEIQEPAVGAWCSPTLLGDDPPEAGGRNAADAPSHSGPFGSLIWPQCRMWSPRN